MNSPIDDFNALDAADATAVVRVWADVPRWAAAIVAGRPYPSAEALEARAMALAGEWTDADVDAALAKHPRIGARLDTAERDATERDATGDRNAAERGAATGGADATPGAELAASRREQASMSTAPSDVAAAIAAGNAAYEQRFGRVFLIRAAGRSPDEILRELERRLGNDDDTEAREVRGQLAEIAALRLREALA